MELATSVVEQAQAGEGMEVYVTRGTENEVRAYDGAVESLTSADSSGVGIRVVLDGPDGQGSRLGFAWAGSLDPDVVRAALSDARDNARYATPDPDVVLAEPDGLTSVEQDLWDDAVITTPMEEKIALALDLERATRAADPRVRQVSSADYSDGRVEVALASTTGIRSTSRRTTAFLSVDAIAGEGADSQTGTGFSVGRSPARLDAAEAMDDAVLRATRLLGAQKAQSGRCTVVFDPRVVSTLLSVVSSALSGEAVVKGRSFFAGRIGETVANAAVTLTDDPTDSRAFSAVGLRRGGVGLPAQRAHLRRRAPDVRLRHGLGPPGADPLDRLRRARGFLGHALRRVPGPGAHPRGDERRRHSRPGRRRAVRPVGHRHALGGQPGERGLLRGSGRPDDPRRLTGRTGP